MSEFSKKLTHWYSINKRDLPWRETKNPFKIWLSEIILQQTRVAQGMDYYYKFIHRFSTPIELADADQDEVLKLWQGLGYYSRARNLHAAAKTIKEEYAGEFPKTYREIIQLKGVGEYTAAAIASFAFGEKKAVVDGNVFRVLSRIFGIATPIDSTPGKKEFKELAEALLSDEHPDLHNQAIMEFGALQCTPKSPNCSSCPFQYQCEAKSNGTISELPVKSKKLKQRDRYFHYIHWEHQNKIYLHQRTGKDIWQDLYQFPMVETHQKEEPAAVLQHLSLPVSENRFTLISSSKSYKHVLSHQIIHATFLRIKSEIPLDKNYWIKKGWIEVSIDEIDTFAVPRLIDKYMGDIGM